MVEITGEIPPPASSSARPNPWPIIIAICIVLCCFCVGAIGLLFAFGGPILNELGIIKAVLPALII